MSLKNPRRDTPAPVPPIADAVEERSDALRSRLAEWVLGTVVGRFKAFYAAIFLGVGGLVLAIAWHAGPQKYLDARTFEKLTARAPARIVESWLAVEFEPGIMGEYTNWRPFAKASPCVVVEYESGWTGPARRAFCGTRLPFYEHYTLHDVKEVTAGVPFSWKRDERGFVVPEIRVSKAAMDYFAGREAQSAGTRLSVLRQAYERPDDEAIVGWGQAEPEVAIAIDPAHPADTWPAGYIEDAKRRAPDWITGVIGMLIGLAFWFAGIRILAGGWRWPVVLLVGLLPLLWLPWFSEQIPPVVRSMNAGFGGVVADLMGDVDGFDHFVASAPDDAMLARGERIVWRAGDRAYAQTFGKIAFKPPNPQPRDPDAALLALADTVAAQMRAMDDDGRAAVFEALAQDKVEGRSKTGFVFLRAGREALVDPRATEALRDRARRFLDTWVTQPVEEPYPGQIAFDARVRLLRELTTLPKPNSIAIPAGWIVDRAEARRREAK